MSGRHSNCRVPSSLTTNESFETGCFYAYGLNCHKAALPTIPPTSLFKICLWIVKSHQITIYIPYVQGSTVRIQQSAISFVTRHPKILRLFVSCKDYRYWYDCGILISFLHCFIASLFRKMTIIFIYVVGSVWSFVCHLVHSRRSQLISKHWWAAFGPPHGVCCSVFVNISAAIVIKKNLLPSFRSSHVAKRRNNG